MNKEEIFSIWAPQKSPWSCWAKPVLFAHMNMAFSAGQAIDTTADVNWFPAADGKTAIILDLPGADGVLAGVALAERGYCPVPLYNAVPLPTVGLVLDPVAAPRVAAVDVLPILSALFRETERLAQQTLPTNAPPVFLLDANRHADGRTMLPDQFDNRSVCFTTDFPSANFLLAHGIERVLLVQQYRTYPLSDLAHVLRRWQDGGLVLERMRMDTPTAPERFEVSKPSWFGMIFQRALATFGFRRASSGGFGAWVPNPSAGG